MVKDRFKFRTPVFIAGIFKKYFYWDAEDGRPTVIEMFGDTPTAFICGEDEQCMGIKDKNKNLIYENDIIKSPSGCLQKVIWRYGNFIGVDIDSTNEQIRGVRMFGEFSEYQEIIGNIHDKGE